jgi:hypothetical protein
LAIECSHTTYRFEYSNWDYIYLTLEGLDLIKEGYEYSVELKIDSGKYHNVAKLISCRFVGYDKLAHQITLVTLFCCIIGIFNSF